MVITYRQKQFSPLLFLAQISSLQSLVHSIVISVMHVVVRIITRLKSRDIFVPAHSLLLSEMHELKH